MPPVECVECEHNILVHKHESFWWCSQCGGPICDQCYQALPFDEVNGGRACTACQDKE